MEMGLEALIGKICLFEIFIVAIGIDLDRLQEDARCVLH